MKLSWYVYVCTADVGFEPRTDIFVFFGFMTAFVSGSLR